MDVCIERRRTDRGHDEEAINCLAIGRRKITVRILGVVKSDVPAQEDPAGQMMAKVIVQESLVA